MGRKHRIIVNRQVSLSLGKTILHPYNGEKYKIYSEPDYNGMIGLELIEPLRNTKLAFMISVKILIQQKYLIEQKSDPNLINNQQNKGFAAK